MVGLEDRGMRGAGHRGEGRVVEMTFSGSETRDAWIGYIIIRGLVLEAPNSFEIFASVEQTQNTQDNQGQILASAVR